ncbi:2-polyprenyl-6-methoxyphenol hydroxylase-like FAD-dependent oxidoreductase [Nocardioides albertanoniae]|uniref:2-polyprenyl-6-methoxyphenol hydroxylase-like FAD-dependent oxidoreductase n=1 Tax=Nocardioides albertanoniae TaxID=1175486 RepID=A0A543A8Z5_9ACTN|nr:FAD-dependent monooxygenase [Nocardioides albertanoniae]TQL68980.1 2-polyprenyl-6-methoxyphenol hydroxylase-like FAD-dependent oxidoreductase [Nocardioides albertanoniae]
MTHLTQSDDTRRRPSRKVLISGASVAGTTLAYWLNRHGIEVTVVEKAAGVRSGGYPIDVRGTALEVVRRMGVLLRLQKAHVDLRRFTFVDADGDQITSVSPQSVTGGQVNDLEVRRGDLTDALYATVRDDVEFLFDDSIAVLDQSTHGVTITFASGAVREFDLVIGADGLHSNTRGLAFGPEAQFHRYLGRCFAIFTMPNSLGLSHESLIWNTPGRAAAIYAVDEAEPVHGFLTFARSEQPFDVFRDLDAQRTLVTDVFADAGWEVPGMLKAMHESDDIFFDAVSQIRMSRWSSGRVALAGDAAYAPSFLTGQGTSLALVGAYMLADAIATQDHLSAFDTYEQTTRGFVTDNQDLLETGSTTLFPTTPEALAQRDDQLRNLSRLPASQPHPAHSSLVLPDLVPTT